ncbi:UNVERIFIED_CONTAM: hypothetical protein K2H54_033679 [Gekko kuhli]
MVLQKVVEEGQLEVTDTLIDDNNAVIRTSVSIEIRYQAMDGTVGAWNDEEFLESPIARSEGDPYETDTLLPSHRQSPSKASAAERALRR